MACDVEPVSTRPMPNSMRNVGTSYAMKLEMPHTTDTNAGGSKGAADDGSADGGLAHSSELNDSAEPAAGAIAFVAKTSENWSSEYPNTS